MPEISPQLREFAQEVFSGKTDQKPCQDCGGVHSRACPRISSVAVQINEQGVIVSRDVTYWAPGTWEKYGIIWAEDVYDDDAGGS